jgi:AGZA family xanthine/uracil permease-like MFS transporter
MDPYDQSKPSNLNRLLECIFKLSARNTHPKTEVMAGLTTFVTMHCIMFLNPTIMSKTGMPFDGLFWLPVLVPPLAAHRLPLMLNP